MKEPSMRKYVSTRPTVAKLVQPSEASASDTVEQILSIVVPFKNDDNGESDHSDHSRSDQIEDVFTVTMPSEIESPVTPDVIQYDENSINSMSSGVSTESIASVSTLSSGSLQSSSSLENIDDKASLAKAKQYMEIWNVGGKNFFKCTVCCAFPDIVKLYCNNTRKPAITDTAGTQYRTNVLREHIKSNYHKQCMKAHALKPLSAAVNSKESSSLDKLIMGSNAKLANEVGKLAISIYVDAKKLSLSAYSWPARQVAFRMAECFDFNNPSKNEAALKKISLHRLNPIFHREMLTCIVGAESGLLERTIEDCVALSLRIDGSVDRTCLDKIYIIAKVVNQRGEVDSIFLGVGVQKERKAEGLLAIVMETINLHGHNLYEKVLRKMSSIVTDGATVNTGEYSFSFRFYFIWLCSSAATILNLLFIAICRFHLCIFPF